MTKIYHSFELQLKAEKIQYRKETTLKEILGDDYKQRHVSDFGIFLNNKLALIVEIEGGIFNNGRHNRGKGYHNDCLKYNLITCKCSVIRFTSQMAVNSPVDCVEFIKLCINDKITAKYLNDFMNKHKLR